MSIQDPLGGRDRQSFAITARSPLAGDGRPYNTRGINVVPGFGGFSAKYHQKPGTTFIPQDRFRGIDVVPGFWGFPAKNP